MRVVGPKLSQAIVEDFWDALYPYLSSDGSEWSLTSKDEHNKAGTVVLHYLQPEERGQDADALRGETLKMRSGGGQGAGTPGLAAFLVLDNDVSVVAQVRQLFRCGCIAALSSSWR